MFWFLPDSHIILQLRHIGPSINDVTHSGGGAKNLKKWVTTDVIYEWPPIPLAYHLLYRMVRVRSHEHALHTDVNFFLEK